MHPANTALSAIDLGTPALRWPEMERVTISLQSPDDQGAVAYYFDTLCKSDPAGYGDVGRAACAYLLGLVQSKGLALVRGPFLTAAPEHGPLPDGWQMVRALVWVEEFDHLVPTDDSDETAPLYCFTVNGRTQATVDGHLTYRRVCELAGYGEAAKPTVVWGRGGEGGILAPGDAVNIPHKGVHFDVAITSGA